MIVEKKLNNFKFQSHRSVLMAFLCLTLFSSCAESKNSLKAQFKNDDSYFMALKALEQNEQKSAIRLFSKSAEKSNPKIARLAAEKLTTLGNVSERNHAAKILVKKYGDEDALLTASEVFYSQGEFSRIISLTDRISLTTSPNRLVVLRLNSLLKRKDERLKNELFNWFTTRPVTESHESFYSDYLKSLNPVENNLNSSRTTELPPDIQIMNYRILIFKKNYRTAFNETKNIFELYKLKGTNPHYQLLSDIGKAALYGTGDFTKTARDFENLANSYVLAAGKIQSQEEASQVYELAYCAYFYAARLYDRAGRFQEKVVQRFKSALDCTQDTERFDNALWYLLNMQLRMSTDDIIVTLKKYSSKISNKEWFDDFFDNFSVLLLSHEKWQDFYDVWKLIDTCASEETACKFAYISGRILEEGYGETNGKPKTKEAVAAFTRVLSGNADTYYKVCALERLNIVDPTYVKDVLCSGGPEKTVNEDENARILLTGYAAYGFPQLIYEQWLKDRKNLSIETNIQVCRFLNDCGNFDNNYSVQSLRVASRTKRMWSGKIPYELLELNFPRFYSNFVQKACQENNLKESLLYALIRSESFFDAKAGSSAGAKGLTQLMSATANDEARKLKLRPDFDIFDPETNITLGSHYYAGLIERTEGKSELLALFAYNAGLTNVRRWKRPAKMSMDIYLETLPFQETREYGRKLVGAGAMYAFLYEGITPAETVHSLMR